ncbi:4298_t:CDS:2, partial [Racocetra fulgida]
WFLKEGEYFEPIKEIAKVKGKACNILLGERTALNIIARCSGIATREAIEHARNVCGFSLMIDVECQTEAEADEAIQAGANVIMLDNFESKNLKSCAKSLKQKWTDKKFLLESSGGITDENITEYFCPGMLFLFVTIYAC